MPAINTTSAGTVYTPSPYEIQQNNERKRQRREHQQLLLDVAELKQQVKYSKKAKAKSVRRKYY